MTHSVTNSVKRVYPKINPVEILLTELDPNSAGANTIGRYLNALNRALLVQQEGFSGKRPFGESNWETDLVHGLILAGHLDGVLDCSGEVSDYDSVQFYDIMRQVFNFLDDADFSTLTLPPEPKEYAILQLRPDGINPEEERIGGYVTELKTLTEAESWLETNPRCGNDFNWVIVKVK